MASLTVWLSRRGKRWYATDPGQRLLCGWHVGPTFCASRPIAWLNDEEDTIYLPMGLTDAETPGEFRWSQAVVRARASKRPTVSKPIRNPTWGSQRARIVPCERGHLNRIDNLGR